MKSSRKIAPENLVIWARLWGTPRSQRVLSPQSVESRGPSERSVLGWDIRGLVRNLGDNHRRAAICGLPRGLWAELAAASRRPPVAGTRPMQFCRGNGLFRVDAHPEGLQRRARARAARFCVCFRETCQLLQWMCVAKITYLHPALA